MLQVATPVAVTSYMLAAKYRARPDEVAGLVVVSTLIVGPGDPAAFRLFCLSFRLALRAEAGTLPATTCGKTREQLR